MRNVLRYVTEIHSTFMALTIKNRDELVHKTHSGSFVDLEDRIG
jgi:hypothetical protein